MTPFPVAQQVIEMAGSILRNLSDDHELRKEYNKQGAIRPLVNLLRVSQERNDLENTINAVRCMDAISVVQENGQAMRWVRLASSRMMSASDH